MVNKHSACAACSASCTKEIDFAKKEVQDLKETPVGLILKNENVNEDMVKILKQFHSFLPKTCDQGVG